MGAVAAGMLALGAGGAAEAGDFPATALSYSETMFDRQDHVTDKVGPALQARRSGELRPGTLTFGGRLLGSVIWEDSNTAGKFPILSRLPPTHTSGTHDSYGVINEASFNATLSLPMVTAFAQAEYTELAYTGQDRVQLRKYWVALGDLNLSPFYAALGRKTVHFGRFDTYAPFTHSHSSHYFWAQSDDPVVEVGYIGESTNLAFTLIPDHRGLRVISSPSNNGGLGNFAVNGSHRFDLGDRSLTLGAGFLRGTIYDSAIAHHPPATGSDRKWNGAIDVNATYETEHFDLQAEVTTTEKIWPATGDKARAMTIQGRYRAGFLGKPAVYSLSLSRGTQGPSGSEWERMDQAIFGVEWQAARHVRLGAEYMYNKGFVPLILPTVTGDRDVESHTVILGAKLTF